ncbi:aldo/keto reductase [uncultured Paraglaciecola sp.]|uniref:aldo/keto reductase n=1 Tax=uncultured Paraglaciecola sp. TaxID=1765024 RepID=UPI002609E1FD|nr:aldo/keto reductase [uncultured Paraglaciecola sp.]
MTKNDPGLQYSAAPNRYKSMSYQRCGKSGLKLPSLSLGLWQNFGAVDSSENAKSMLHRAFDLGINHFDLANNYGPPYGSAETTFGQVMAKSFKPYRDEILISSKAGYDMWPGPYGMGGSRKYMVASCDQSLKRTGLDYFDVFYSHCYDPDTPLEETMQALDYIVRSGRAMYVGISSYSAVHSKQAIRILQDLGTPLLIHQPSYNMFDRRIENGLTDVLLEEKIGAIVFSPLAQGLLTNKYLNGVPQGSRAARSEQVYLNQNNITPDKIAKVKQLNELARQRGQSLAQMALAWVLNNKAVTSAIIGASNINQIADCVASLDTLDFSQQELTHIDTILGQ